MKFNKVFFCSEYFITLVDKNFSIGNVIGRDKFIVAKINYLFLFTQILNYQGIQFTTNLKTCMTIWVTNNKNNITNWYWFYT